jgi:hypothetical protein
MNHLNLKSLGFSRFLCAYGTLLDEEGWEVMRNDAREALAFQTEHTSFPSTLAVYRIIVVTS